MAVHVMLHGAGRMAREIVLVAEATADVRCTGMVDREAGDAFHGVPVLGGWPDAPEEDVIVDFSLAAGTAGCISAAIKREKPLVCGTTGLDAGTLDLLDQAAATIPVLYAPNMSLGVSLLRRAVRMVASALPGGAEVEIVEAHHTGKADTPSGTAQALAEDVVGARGDQAPSTIEVGRPRGKGLRKQGEVTVHSLRLGKVPGTHEVHFGFGEEQLTLTHIAGSRAIFAQGAITAARFIAGKPPGRYTIEDVLEAP